MPTYISYLRTYLEKIAEAIARSGIDVSELKKAIEKIGVLEKAFLIVKPFAKGLNDLNSILSTIGRDLEARDDSALVAKVKEIASRIDTLIMATHRASAILRILFISIAIVLALASYSLTLVPMPEAFSVVNTAIFALSIVVASAIAIGALLYLNSIVLLLPLLATVVSIQVLMELSIAAREILGMLYIAVALSIAMLIATMKIVLSSMSYYRRALLALLSIERIANTLSNTVVKKVEEVKPLVSEDLVKKFERVYGERARELLKYIEDISKLRE